MSVVSAQDLVPAAYAEEEDVEIRDDFDYDLRQLYAYDPHPVDVSSFSKKQIDDSAEVIAQQLINQLFRLPVEKTETGPLVRDVRPCILYHHTELVFQAKLPSFCAVVLPREKPPPKAKEETKWEKFAREKGITNKKKSKMVWDEVKQEWAPRFGYKRANDKETSFIQLKPGQDASDDLFLTGKKANRQKNLAQKQANEVS
jgi:regulator of ribosome biosynthesis